jgi:hypothetical protein
MTALGAEETALGHDLLDLIEAHFVAAAVVSISTSCCFRISPTIRRHAGGAAPRQEFLLRLVISPTRVQVADIGREEFEKAHRGAIAGGGNKRGEHGELIGASWPVITAPQGSVHACVLRACRV